MNTLRGSPASRRTAPTYIGLAIGVLGALALSVAMLPLRGHLHNDNMALALVVPVLIGAVVGGRVAGASVGSHRRALLRLLLHPALPVAAHRERATTSPASGAVWSSRSSPPKSGSAHARERARARESRSDLDRLCRVIEIAARGADIEDVVSSARAELIGLFGLVDCAFDMSPSESTLPRLGDRSAIEGETLVATHIDFLLPPGGVELPVIGRGHEYGRLVLFASQSVPASLQKRLVAIAIADELGLTLATKSGS